MCVCVGGGGLAQGRRPGRRQGTWPGLSCLLSSLPLPHLDCLVPGSPGGEGLPEEESPGLRAGVGSSQLAPSQFCDLGSGSEPVSVPSFQMKLLEGMIPGNPRI